MSALLCITLLTSFLFSQQKTGATNTEKLVFSENETFQNPLPLSPRIQKLILETKEAKGALAYATDSDRHHPERWFTATEVHLGGTHEADLVVMGLPPMRGADNTWFWVIRSVHINPTIVLFAGCNSLELLSETTNGYRNISTDWSTPNNTTKRLYTFNGNRYLLKKTTSAKAR